MEANGYKIEPNGNIHGAHLENGDLTAAFLYDADLSDAKLIGAKLLGVAMTDETIHY